MEKWKPFKLGDIITLKRGYDLPERIRVKGIFPVVSSSGISDFHSNFKIKGPCVVTGRYGTLGLIHYVEDKCWPLNTTLYVKDFKGNDPRFIYYFLQTIHLEEFNSAAAVPGLDRNVLHRIECLYPNNIHTQQSIASILSTYDELIEVNNQRIKLLEETARELFKEWFVRMRFPGYKQAIFVKGFPKEWSIKPIGKIIDYQIGGGWGNDIQDNLFSVSGFVIRGTDIPKIKIGVANKEVYRFHKASNMRSRQLIEGDIVFETAGGSEGQALGRTCYITQELLDSYGDKVMAASFCKQVRTTSIPSLYLYYFLNYLYDTGMIETYQTQSTGISNYQFEPFLKFQQIFLPKDDLMESFHDKTLLIQKRITILGQQNTQLRQIRDRLLPRLISGKLLVKSLNT